MTTSRERQRHEAAQRAINTSMSFEDNLLSLDSALVPDGDRKREELEPLQARVMSMVSTVKLMRTELGALEAEIAKLG